MLRFRKKTLENLKIRKLPLNLETSDFQELFLIKFALSQVDLKLKNVFRSNL